MAVAMSGADNQWTPDFINEATLNQLQVYYYQQHSKLANMNVESLRVRPGALVYQYILSSSSHQCAVLTSAVFETADHPVYRPTITLHHKLIMHTSLCQGADAVADISSAVLVLLDL